MENPGPPDPIEDHPSTPAPENVLDISKQAAETAEAEAAAAAAAFANLQQPLYRLPRELTTLILAYVALDSGRDFRRAARSARIFGITPSDTLFWMALCQHHYRDSETLSIKYNGYYRLFFGRPQPRYNGVYVCTSQYYRHAEQQGGSWYQQLIQVTYYRYIRLWEDGRCQTLVTVRDPEAVLPFGPDYRRDKVHWGEWRIDADRNVLALHVEMDKTYLGHLSFKIQSEGGSLFNKLRWRGLKVRPRDGTWDDIPLLKEGNFYFKRCDWEPELVHTSGPTPMPAISTPSTATAMHSGGSIM